MPDDRAGRLVARGVARATAEGIADVERRTGVRCNVRVMRKGEANCRFPGCYRIRPVGGYYCCKEHDMDRDWTQYEGPIVVFVNTKARAVELGSRLGWACYHGSLSQRERERAVGEFQRDSKAAIALTYWAGCEGIRLDKARSLILLDQAPTVAHREQAIGRVGPECGIFGLGRIGPDA